MRRPIVAGVDGSPEAKAAAHYAAALAKRRNTPLEIVHTYEMLSLGNVPMTVAGSYATADDSLRHAAGKSLDEIVWEIREAHPSLDVTSQLIDGAPASVLIAQSNSALVTVVGSRGTGGFAGLLLGSVSAQVAAHGHGTVIVVRPSASPEDPVLVGYDGSAGSAAALTFGAREALERKVPLLVAHVYREDQDIRHPASEDSAKIAEHVAEQLLNDAIELPMEQHPDLEVRALPIYSRDTDHALVEESAKAALTVVGCRGRGGFAGLLLGSVSRTLVQHAAGPVAVVHPTDH